MSDDSFDDLDDLNLDDLDLLLNEEIVQETDEPENKQNNTSVSNNNNNNENVKVESVVSTHQEGMVTVTKTTTTTTKTIKTPTGTVTTTSTKTHERKKAGLLSGLASGSSSNLPIITPTDIEMSKNAVDLPSGNKSGFLFKGNLGGGVRSGTFQKRWCIVDKHAHTMVYGEFGKVDANVSSKAGENVSSTYVATQKLKSAAGKRFKGFAKSLKGKKKESEEHVEAKDANASRKIVFFQKGVIELDKSLLQSIDDEKLNGKGAFGIGRAARVFVFVPPSIHARNEWLDALREAGATDGAISDDIKESLATPVASSNTNNINNNTNNNNSNTPAGTNTHLSPAAAPVKRHSNTSLSGTSNDSLAGIDLSSNNNNNMNINNDDNDNSKVWLDEQTRLANEYNDGCQYHGFLMKMGGTLGSAPHRRWFSLDGDEAAVPSREVVWGNFVRDKTTDAVELMVRGSASLHNVDVFRVPRAAAPGHRPFCFAINLPSSERSLILFGSSVIDVTNWLNAFTAQGAVYREGHAERLARFQNKADVVVQSDDKEWNDEAVYLDPVARHAQRRERFVKKIGCQPKYLVAENATDDGVFLD